MVVEWTKTALESLKSIAEYISKNDEHQAKNFIQQLHAKIKKLEAFPNLGKGGRVFGTRELSVHKNYLVIYRLKDGKLQIIRIHHTKQKLKLNFCSADENE